MDKNLLDILQSFIPQTNKVEKFSSTVTGDDDLACFLPSFSLLGGTPPHYSTIALLRQYLR
jgi:hypothetical protein